MATRYLLILLLVLGGVCAQEPLIERATANARGFQDQVPNFIADKHIWRYLAETKPVKWRLDDRVFAELVYVDGKETYRNIRINEKPVKNANGVWSTGEFASIQLDIFSRNTKPRFQEIGPGTIAGRAARKFSYAVVDEDSHWTIRGQRKAVRTGYKGTVWIDAEKALILRIEMQAVDLPLTFSFDTAEMTVDYGVVRIGETDYHLPVKAENLACQRGTPYCSRNEVEFHNYRRPDN